MPLRRSATILLPFIALLAGTVSAIVLAAQAGLSFCGNRVALPMPGMAWMPGMDMAGMNMAGMNMPGSTAVMICPVVLVLIVASAALALAAIIVVWRDPHRGLTRRTLVRALACLPLGRTAGVLTLGGGSALILMAAVDGSGAPAPATCALLAVLLAAGSLFAVLASTCAARLALALGRRLILAVVAAIGAVGSPAAPRVRRPVPLVAAAHLFPLLAAGRGLRAPPAFVR